MYITVQYNTLEIIQITFMIIQVPLWLAIKHTHAKFNIVSLPLFEISFS